MADQFQYSKRVLYITNNPHLGSTARVLQEWILIQKNSGRQPCIALQSDGDFASWVRSQKVEYLIDPMPWPNRSSWSAAKHLLRVAWWARQRGVKVIHCNEHDVYPFAAALKTVLRRPAVCHVRFRLDRGFAQWAFKGFRAPDALLWTSQQQWNDSADAVAGIIPESRQHLLRLGLNLATYGTMTDSRDLLRQELGIDPSAIVVGTASPLRPRKRVHEFVDLITNLAPKYPNLVGLIAGQEVAEDEAYRDEIVNKIAASGLGNRLRWLGFLEPVEPFYHACDVIISTSEYETFGNSVCEAMACERTLAGYRGGSVGEVVGDTGLIVETGDFAALRDATERLILDPSLRTTLGRAARQRVAEHFNPAKSFERLKAIYQSLVEQPKVVPSTNSSKDD